MLGLNKEPKRKRNVDERRGYKAAMRSRKNITGGLSGNSHDRRKQRRKANASA